MTTLTEGITAPHDIVIPTIEIITKIGIAWHIEMREEVFTGQEVEYIIKMDVALEIRATPRIEGIQ